MIWFKSSKIQELERKIKKIEEEAKENKEKVFNELIDMYNSLTDLSRIIDNIVFMMKSRQKPFISQTRDDSHKWN